MISPDTGELYKGALQAVPADRREIQSQLRWHPDTDPHVGTGTRATVDKSITSVRIVVDLGPHVTVVPESVVTNEFSFNGDSDVVEAGAIFQQFGDGNQRVGPAEGRSRETEQGRHDEKRDRDTHHAMTAGEGRPVVHVTSPSPRRR